MPRALIYCFQFPLAPLTFMFYCFRDPPILQAHNNTDIILRLPMGKRIRDIRWLSVWCRRFTVSRSIFVFASVCVRPFYHPAAKVISIRNKSSEQMEEKARADVNFASKRSFRAKKTLRRLRASAASPQSMNYTIPFRFGERKTLCGVDSGRAIVAFAAARHGKRSCAFSLIDKFGSFYFPHTKRSVCLYFSLLGAARAFQVGAKRRGRRVSVPIECALRDKYCSSQARISGDGICSLSPGCQTKSGAK